MDRVYKLSACILAITTDGKILTATRRNSPVLALPGGKLDDGETLLQCALRETIEETGMNFNGHSPFHLYGAVIPGRDGRDFYCQAFGILVNGSSDEIQIPGGIEQGITAAWHTPMELLCKGAFVQYNAETLKMALLVEQFKERLHG